LISQKALKCSEGTTERDPKEPGPSAEVLQSSRKRLVEAIPPSVTTLCFAEIEDVVNCQFLAIALSYLLERKNEECPRLQHITLSFDEKKAQDIAGVMSQSLELAKRKGLKLEFIAQKRNRNTSTLEYVGHIDLMALKPQNALEEEPRKTRSQAQEEGRVLTSLDDYGNAI